MRRKRSFYTISGATLGLLSSRRLQLIERNRILLVRQALSRKSALVNAPYWVARLVRGRMGRLPGKGEAARFQGLGGKLESRRALLQGAAQAITMAPATLRKRRAMRTIRRVDSKTGT